MTPRKDVSAERRTQVVQAALVCFTRKGYINTSMDDIALACGLSKGSLYWYFSGKEDLFGEALKSVFSGLEERLNRGLTQTETAAEKLQMIADMAAEFGRTGQGFFGLFIEFWAQSPDRGKAGILWREALDRYKKIISTVLDDGIRQGEFRPQEVEPLTWALMAAYDGLATYRVFMPDLALGPIHQAFSRFVQTGLHHD